MKKIKLTAVFGTRPEAIKMCPLILELQRRDNFDTRLCLTGQHGDMVRSVTDHFGVTPDADLHIMSEGQTLFDITERVLCRFKRELEANSPDVVLVHGDTSSAFAAALCSFYLGIPVGHVEAGLRTYDPFSPYPEEFNRRAIDAISSFCFCPTERNMENLLCEGISTGRCFVTGNTVVDALRYTVGDKKAKKSQGDRIKLLMTVHRRESFGTPIRSILRGILTAASRLQNIDVIFPVHPNPEVMSAVKDIFGYNPPPNIHLTSPMDVVSFHRLLAGCDLVLTDSGGIQEESAALGIPLILVRENTERPESSGSGMIIVGHGEEDIFTAVCRLAEDSELREQMSNAKNPFGDGHASERIADILCCNL